MEVNMPYDVLEKTINSLPEAAVIELTHYVQYLASIYSTKDKKSLLFYAVRNLISFIPIAPIYALIAPKSLGDVIMKTTVEEVK